MITDKMDGSFLHDGKLIYYRIPVGQGCVFGGIEKEKTYREFFFFNADGTIIDTYKAYEKILTIYALTGQNRNIQGQD